jgi:BirA family transcriptional regulator, biotin operon repressor / biotin---[acetyl-CoA-carboxylase] ligase
LPSIKANIIHLQEVDSTNQYAFSLVSQDSDLPEGTIILAEEQSSGQGLAGNKWWSEKGLNLTYSIILTPEFLPVDMQFYLSRITCISIVTALQSFLPGLSIKWPNDIYHENKKLGGILIENNIMGGKISHSIVGIGININQTSFPSWIPNPTSLKLICGKEIETACILDLLLQAFFNYYELLQGSSYEDIQKEYVSLLLGYKKSCNFILQDRSQISAIIDGVADSGELILQMEDISKRFFHFKELEYVFPINK